MPLHGYVERIQQAVRHSRSESRLEWELNEILRDCLAEYGIHFDPHVNETLSSMGLSQVDANRPDGVFGHIVYDYKAPNSLGNPRTLARAKSQVESYLDSITGGHASSPGECAKWFGYLCDGAVLVYCRSNNRAWVWSKSMPVTENALLFLIHAYRSLSRKPLTSPFLSQTFGKDAPVARELIRVMCNHLDAPHHKTTMLFREWRRLFEQVSTYNLAQIPSLQQWALENDIRTEDASQILFAMHSYYSMVVKILTSELLSVSSEIMSSICDEITAAPTSDQVFNTLERVENGEYFQRYRISNFLEGDFFSWYINERTDLMAEAIRGLAREFLSFEPASAILQPEAKRDLLKEFYSALVDEQIRHDLGEYYTPDWLAQHLLNLAGYDGSISAKILDPTCGSGTFLVECISRLRAQCERADMSPLQTLHAVLSNVKGLDLNPLAVISARANYILSINDLVFSLGEDIELPVYLADSINVPVEKNEGDSRYLEYILDTEIGAIRIEIPYNLVHAQILGKVLLICEEAIKQNLDFARFMRNLQSNPTINSHLTDDTARRLEQFYANMLSLESRDWDKIWCRILKNNFSPAGFSSFDYIIGNPPWVRWSRLPETYRNRVKEFCTYYGLVSGRGYSGGIESDISTVITFSAADN